MKRAIVVISRPGANWNPNKPNREQAYWDDHASFMDALFDAGQIILGGPFPDASGSMLILAAESVEAARALLKDDPWAQREILAATEFREWTIFLDVGERIKG